MARSTPSIACIVHAVGGTASERGAAAASLQRHSFAYDVRVKEGWAVTVTMSIGAWEELRKRLATRS